MKKFTIVSASTAFVGLAAAVIATAGIASAAPIVTSNAADAAAGLQSQGYTVAFNGIQRGPLSKCSVTGVHGLDGRAMTMESLMSTTAPAGFEVVYLDIDCLGSNN
jgi:hypothetical protein